jgi:hypothetical protein
MKPVEVHVSDLMQQDYRYLRTEPPGRSFHPGFAPELSPLELLMPGI